MALNPSPTLTERKPIALVLTRAEAHPPWLCDELCNKIVFLKLIPKKNIWLFFSPFLLLSLSSFLCCVFCFLFLVLLEAEAEPAAVDDPNIQLGSFLFLSFRLSWFLFKFSLTKDETPVFSGKLSSRTKQTLGPQSCHTFYDTLKR